MWNFATSERSVLFPPPVGPTIATSQVSGSGAAAAHAAVFASSSKAATSAPGQGRKENVNTACEGTTLNATPPSIAATLTQRPS